jgi:ABC-type antimicrobial peptide transport system permease subunit
MIYLTYMLSELRRRRGRTLLTALGLGVGVGLVIAVSALSSGLDRAQAAVLAPLTGVGTDMSVSRPISISGDPRSAFQKLSASERAQLQKELGFGGRIDFSKLTPGSTFTQTIYRGSQFSFAASEVKKIASLSGVEGAAGGLTLSVSTISGTVPNQTQAPSGQGGGFGGGPAGGGGGGGGGRFGGNASVAATTITGVDTTKTGIGAITESQLTKGHWFTTGSAHQAILDTGYATTKSKTVGDTITVGKTVYTIVGLVKTPIGGQASDVYVKLGQLQAASGRAGRVNTVYVRATSASAVSALSRHIKTTLSGASVTTAQTLANSVTGSLSSAKDLTQKLGLGLELIGLLGAILIASLLTLSSVTKRVRELGTLKALGWSRRLVIRQVTGESLLQGLLGGVIGIGIGLAGAALITVFAPTLKASFATAAQTLPGPFGQGAVQSTASQTVSLTAHVSPGVIALAVLLAIAGGLVAGATGALRASRLRPVEALRHID